MSDSVWPHPWDSPGKNTGVGSRFLLQCMKVKSESEVTQSCPTLRDPMDCSPPGSSVHGIFQARVLEWVPLPSLLNGLVAKKHAAINSPRRKEKERKELTNIYSNLFFFFFETFKFCMGYKQSTNNVVIVSSEEWLESLNSQVLY